KLGQPIDEWLYQARPLPLAAHVGARLLAGVGRLGGYRFPLPAFQSPEDGEPLARRLAARAAAGGTVVVRANGSAAVRVARAALDASIRLDGVLFFVAGEPITESRRSLMESTGARVI